MPVFPEFFVTTDVSPAADPVFSPFTAEEGGRKTIRSRDGGFP